MLALQLLDKSSMNIIFSYLPHHVEPDDSACHFHKMKKKSTRTYEVKSYACIYIIWTLQRTYCHLKEVGFSSLVSKKHCLIKRKDASFAWVSGYRRKLKWCKNCRTRFSRTYQNIICINNGAWDLLIQNCFFLQKVKGRQCKGRWPRNFDFFSWSSMPIV